MFERVREYIRGRVLEMILPGTISDAFGVELPVNDVMANRIRHWKSLYMDTLEWLEPEEVNDFKSAGVAAAVASELLETNLDPNQLNERLIKFIDKVYQLTGRWPDNIYPDSAEQVLIRGMKTALETAGYRIAVHNAWKTKINDRINLVVSLIGLNRFSYTDHAETVKNALINAVYDEKKDDTQRLDNGTTDIDTLDSLEYSIERYATKLLRQGVYNV